MPFDEEAFTVSYWWRCADLAGAGSYEGPVFATITSAHPNQEWQLATFADDLDFRDGAVIFTTPKSLYPDDIWYHTVIQSPAASSNVTVWISSEGGTLNKVVDNFPGNYMDLSLSHLSSGLTARETTTAFTISAPQRSTIPM